MTIQFTGNYQLPYPALDRSDTADVPRDIKALADKVDTALLGLRRDDLIGELKLWPINGAPTGFVICDGSLLLRAGTYSKLFTAIGTVYNLDADSDITRFRIPDLRGRVPVGPDGTANRLVSAPDLLGKSGGEEEHILTANQSGRNLGGEWINTSNFQWQQIQTPQDSANPRYAQYVAPGAHVTALTDSSGAAHNNMQPYQVVNYIIRYA
jgi:microcystin-dependent protein